MSLHLDIAFPAKTKLTFHVSYSAIAISLGSTVFNSKLRSELESAHVPASELVNIFGSMSDQGGGESQKLQLVIADAVCSAINSDFLISVVTGLMAFLVAFVTERVRVRKLPAKEKQ